jgi:hypothetical protein
MAESDQLALDSPAPPACGVPKPAPRPVISGFTPRVRTG